jgi:hypothetical protein
VSLSESLHVKVMSDSDWMNNTLFTLLHPLH